MNANGQTRSLNWQRADWFACLIRRALRETDDADTALRAAEMAIEVQPFPEGLDADFAFDENKVKRDAGKFAKVQGTKGKEEGAKESSTSEGRAEDVDAKAAAEDYAKNGTKAKAFKAWFGDSKVVDDKGEPQVVYHGSRKEFDAFKSRTKNAWSDSLGFDTYFFAEGKAVASTYGKVQENYLSIKKPLEIDAHGGEWIDAISVAIDKLQTYRTPEEREFLAAKEEYFDKYAYEAEYEPDSIPAEETKKIDDAARKFEEHILANKALYRSSPRQPYGHDGIIVKNVLDMTANPVDDEIAEYSPFTTVYIAFRPSQIKAVANQGTFDPSSDKIAMSLNATFSFDIFNPKAQGILNKAMKAAAKLSARSRRELASILKSQTVQEMSRRLEAWGDRWRLQLANLLTSTQLASLLSGMRQVASSVPLSPPLGVRDAALPASLPLEDAAALIDLLGELPYERQQEELYQLPPDQQAYARVMLAAEAAKPPKPPRIVPDKPPAGSPERMHWPIIDEAARLLSEKNLVTRPEFDRLNDAARAKAFTVAGVSSRETLQKVRDVMSDQIAKGVDVKDFRDNVMKEVEPGTFISEAHLEQVFRTNVQSAFTDGTNKILDHPFIASGFPYAAYEPIHDDRVRPEHRELEKHGIDGSNVYRRDDPTFVKFQPPWDYNCRCSWIPLSIRSAAEQGVQEAQRWLDTGIAPESPAWVTPPPFEPDPSFRRSLDAAPLSVQLSATPVSDWDNVVLGQWREDHDASLASWSAYQGTQGGRGWKNAATGEIRYQTEKPSDAGGQDQDPSAASASSGGKLAAVVARVKSNAARLSAIADKVPAVGRIKQGVQTLMGGIHAGLAKRYGDTAATAIMTSGALGGYGVMAAAQAMVGFPGIPIVNDLISIAAHTAVAETVLQLRKLAKATGIAASLAIDEGGLQQEVVDQLSDGIRELLQADFGELSEALQTPEVQAEVAALLEENKDLLEGEDEEDDEIDADFAFDENKVKRDAGKFAKVRGAKGKGEEQKASAAEPASIAEAEKKPPDFPNLQREWEGWAGAGNGVHPTKGMYENTAKHVPGLTPDKWKDFLMTAWQQGALEMHVLNEVREASDAWKATAIHKDDKMYGYIFLKNPEKMRQVAEKMFGAK